MGSSVAVQGPAGIATLSNEDPMGHTEKLADLLSTALQKSGNEPLGVATVVQGIGPGPFTGLRVGLATAGAFALATKSQLLSVISHDAVALEHYRTKNTAGEQLTEIRVVQDAKRRELFVTTYEGLDEAGLPIRSRGPEIIPRQEFTAQETDLWPSVINAKYLLEVAELMSQSSRVFPANQALYLREPDVNLLAPKKILK